MSVEPEYLNSQFIHVKWRLIRPHIANINSLADVVADPNLNHQILSTTEPPIDFAEICRQDDPEYFSYITELLLPEPAALQSLAASSQPRLTEKTASIIYYWLRMRRMFPDLKPGPVVEVGAGLGILARILLEFSPAESYHIIDIPEMHQVQRQYFSACNVDVSRIHFHNVLDEALLARDWRAENYMLILSTWGLSETTAHFREWIATQIASRCSAVYFVGQSIFHKQQVDEHLRQLLSAEFGLQSRSFLFSEPDYPCFELAGQRTGFA